MSDEKTLLRKEETHCLLRAIEEYENNNFSINKANTKKWPYILDSYNHLVTNAKRCKQTRTLRVRYQKLISMYSSHNKIYLEKYFYDEDVDLLKRIIAITSEKNNASVDDSLSRETFHHMLDEENSANEEEQPLDTIKVLPRSSYLSTKKEQAHLSSTETASQSNTTHSYNSIHNTSNNGKKLSILYGAAMMDDLSTTHSDISRDLEIAHMKETIKSLQETVSQLEHYFSILSDRLDKVEQE
ncbi:hypothetical protein ACO0OL_000291 [Hanseniaspora opuntiae]|jgi:hypothetical protein